LGICQEYLHHLGIQLNNIKLYQHSIPNKIYDNKGKVENHYYRRDELIIVRNNLFQLIC